ncbi:MAG TPA: hypothetical protein VMG33_13305 [Steroidobacteraceae bacterium]|nr:hypothetical protein [Steroidobacteraceae bacterium]HUI60075.1 hypothetical protein [Steroidobacteraceae bacterium]
MRIVRIAAIGLGVTYFGAAAAAGLDGTQPLTCAGLAGYSCEPTAQCSKLKPEAGSKIKPEMHIDFAGKTVKTPYRTSLLPIQNSAVNDEQLQMQGTDLKFAWSAVVNRKTGKVTVTIADRVGAYVIFGECKVTEGGG